LRCVQILYCSIFFTCYVFDFFEGRLRAALIVYTLGLTGIFVSNTHFLEEPAAYGYLFSI